jgi:hypothetical protein
MKVKEPASKLPFYNFNDFATKTKKSFCPSYENFDTVKKTSQPKFAFEDLGEI